MLSLFTFRRFLGSAAMVAEGLGSPTLLRVRGLTLKVPGGPPRREATRRHHADESSAADPAWTVFMRGM